MDAIRIINATRVAGRHLDPGTVCTVPDQVSAHDANELMLMGRAVACDAGTESAKAATRPPRQRSAKK